MIKFFRNIRRKLLTENRASKYLIYAFGEIFLVVIGILIALQINNWNTQQQKDKEEQKILKVLKSEVNYNKNELHRNIEKATRLKEREDSLLALFQIPIEQIDPNSINIRSLIGGMGAYSTYDPSNGALNNLMGSGELNLIKNDSLRLLLSRWFGELQDIKEDEVRIIDYGDTYLTPFIIEFYNANKASRFKRNTISLFENPQFENIVSRRSKGIGYIIENYKGLNLEIDKILDLIDAEIK